MQQMSFISQLLNRLKSESPSFFKKLQNIGLLLCALAGIVIGLPKLEVFEIPTDIVTISQYILTFAAGLTITAKTATTDTNLQQGIKVDESNPS